MRRLGIITLVAAICVSAVAEYFSISGLAALFAAAATEVVLMGCALGVGKLTAAAWLHANWRSDAVGWPHKLTLAAMVLALMAITSAGIFGFLSRAYLEQQIPAGLATISIEPREMELRQAQSSAHAASARIDQLDTSVQALVMLNAVTKSVTLRDSQAPERAILAAQLSTANAATLRISQEIASLRTQAAETGAKLGPVKYIAAALGWTDPDAAVRAIILLVMCAFDPLAVLLLIAATATLAEHPATPPRRKRSPRRQTAQLVLLDSKRTVA